MNNEELVKRYQAGDRGALDILLEHNKRLIYKIAKKYLHINPSLELDDLFNTGAIGFINALNKYKFDVDVKAKFTTYAVHYITREILSCVNGRSFKDIENNKLINTSISIYTQINANNDSTVIEDTIEDKNNDMNTVDDKIFMEQLRAELEDVFKNNLTLEQEQIIKLRYGWTTNSEMTLKEIADIFNVGQERIRRIESKSLRIIRASKWYRMKCNEYYNELFGGCKFNYESIERKIDFTKFLINKIKNSNQI